MKFKTIAMTGVMSLAGLGLVGAGAHAVFTTSTTSAQTISAGTPAVVLYAAGAVSALSGSPCATLVNADYPPSECTEITLPAVGPFGSTFDSTPDLVTITNIGTLPVTLGSISLSATTSTPAGNTFISETNVCLAGATGSLPQDGSPVGALVVANGPLKTALATPVTLLTTPTTPIVLAANNAGPTSQDAYSVDFYAGQQSAVCGAIVNSGPYNAAAWGQDSSPTSLTTGAEGGSVTVTVKVSGTA